MATGWTQDTHDTEFGMPRQPGFRWFLRSTWMYSPQHLARMSQECRKKWECWPAIGQKSINNRQICWPGSQVRYLQTHVHDMPKPHFPGTRAGHASSTGRNASGRTGWNKPGRRRQSGWIIILVPGTSLAKNDLFPRNQGFEKRIGKKQRVTR